MARDCCRYSSLIDAAAKGKTKDSKESDLVVSEPFKLAVIDEVGWISVYLVFGSVCLCV